MVENLIDKITKSVREARQAQSDEDLEILVSNAVLAYVGENSQARNIINQFRHKYGISPELEQRIDALDPDVSSQRLMNQHRAIIVALLVAKLSSTETAQSDVASDTAHMPLSELQIGDSICFAFEETNLFIAKVITTGAAVGCILSWMGEPIDLEITTSSNVLLLGVMNYTSLHYTDLPFDKFYPGLTDGYAIIIHYHDTIERKIVLEPITGITVTRNGETIFDTD